LDALRLPNGTSITAPEIAKAAMADKGMEVDDTALLGAVIGMVLLSLGRLRRRGDGHQNRHQPGRQMGTRVLILMRTIKSLAN
jgi:hypothetical protein